MRLLYSMFVNVNITNVGLTGQICFCYIQLLISVLQSAPSALVTLCHPSTLATSPMASLVPRPICHFISSEADIKWRMGLGTRLPHGCISGDVKPTTSLDRATYIPVINVVFYTGIVVFLRHCCFYHTSTISPLSLAC